MQRSTVMKVLVWTLATACLVTAPLAAQDPTARLIPEPPTKGDSASPAQRHRFEPLGPLLQAKKVGTVPNHSLADPVSAILCGGDWPSRPPRFRPRVGTVRKPGPVIG